MRSEDPCQHYVSKPSPRLIIAEPVRWGGIGKRIWMKVACVCDNPQGDFG